MSTNVFPSLIGQDWNIVRTPMWSTTKQTAASGQEVRVSYWSYPRWQWKVAYNVLRQNATMTEYSQLAGFFNQLYGSWDSFLYTDTIDNSVTDQGIGTGDGSTTAFQLVRSFGGFVEPMFAPNVVTNIKDNGVVVNPANYTVSTWGSSTPGVVTFNTPPANGHVLTATFSFYFPVRFNDDTLDFTQLMVALLKGEGFTFTSIKA